jgi:hypothetical protein
MIPRESELRVSEFIYKFSIVMLPLVLLRRGRVA